MGTLLEPSVRSPARGLCDAALAQAALLVASLLVASLWGWLVEKARYALEVLAACLPNLAFPAIRDYLE